MKRVLKPVCVHKPVEVLLDEEAAAAAEMEVIEDTERIQARD